MTKSKYIYSKLSFSQRLALQEALEDGISQREASKLLEISRTTILREMKRCSGRYSAEEAQLHADQIKIEKDENNKKYRNEIKSRLEQMEFKIIYLENFIKTRGSINE